MTGIEGNPGGGAASPVARHWIDGKWVASEETAIRGVPTDCGAAL
jgi:hypothetical protein